MTARTPFVPGVTKYGKLTILKYEDGKWHCKCDCGNLTQAYVYNVKSGKTKSCGCGVGYNTHGMSYSYEYRIYNHMLDRGAAGAAGAEGRYRAVVCRRWARKKTGFTRFFEKMGKAPSEEHTLDRIDNDGNYSCGDCSECKRKGWVFNCRWATRREQSNNRSNTVMVMWKGVTKPASYWDDEMGYPKKTVAGRIRAGWSVKKVMTTPVRRKVRTKERSDIKLYTFRGKTAPLVTLCKELDPKLGVNYELANWRMRVYGWSLEKALTTPNLQKKRKGS